VLLDVSWDVLLALIAFRDVLGRELEAMTGHWFELILNKGKSGQKAPTPGEVVQASIRRSKQPTTPGE